MGVVLPLEPARLQQLAAPPSQVAMKNRETDCSPQAAPRPRAPADPQASRYTQVAGVALAPARRPSPTHTQSHSPRSRARVQPCTLSQRSGALGQSPPCPACCSHRRAASRASGCRCLVRVAEVDTVSDASSPQRENRIVIVMLMATQLPVRGARARGSPER